VECPPPLLYRRSSLASPFFLSRETCLLRDAGRALVFFFLSLPGMRFPAPARGVFFLTVLCLSVFHPLTPTSLGAFFFFGTGRSQLQFPAQIFPRSFSRRSAPSSCRGVSPESRQRVPSSDHPTFFFSCVRRAVLRLLPLRPSLVLSGLSRRASMASFLPLRQLFCISEIALFFLAELETVVFSLRAG